MAVRSAGTVVCLATFSAALLAFAPAASAQSVAPVATSSDQVQPLRRPRMVRTVRPGWIAAGAVTAVLGYAPAAVLGGWGAATQMRWSLIPVIGPMVSAVGYSLVPHGDFDFTPAFAWPFALIDSAVQGAGLAMLLVGLLGTVRHQSVADGPRRRGVTGVYILPGPGRELAGLTMAIETF